MKRNPKKRKSSTRRKPRLFLAVCGIFGLLAIGLAIYCWSLANEIETGLAGRRWSIPSKVYSDVMLLYPGQHLNRQMFYDKLSALDYRKVARSPKQAGEMRITATHIDLFLRDLDLPSHQRQGYPVRLTMRQNQIQSIRHLGQNAAIPILELEPEEIMLFFRPEREKRQLVNIQQVPEHLKHAVLAAEDNQFYQHRGLDPLGILRALYTNLRSGGFRQGGSTITQQLVKNYFLSPEKTLARKSKEMLMAVTLEVLYPKDEIFEIYLNEIYLGQRGSVSVNGVGEAANFYFGKTVQQLTLSEATVIAGLIKAPNRYSPYKHPQRCLERRNQILRAMHQNGWLTKKSLQRALLKPIQTAGIKGYHKKAPYFIDYLSRQLAVLYSSEALSSMGLTIYTSLDTMVQKAAEEALVKGLTRLERTQPALRQKKPEKKLQGAIIVLQPKTGAMLAMVGGRDYGVSQFNRITQAHRQPGSLFKPMVFLSGFDQLTAISKLSNAPRSYTIDHQTWTPRNFKPSALKTVSLREAMVQSLNVAAVDLAMQVGLSRIVDNAQAFEFSTPLAPYPSLALGAFEMIPLELARAYCAFAADGVLPYPLSVREVVDESGAPLERRHLSIQRIMPPEKAYLMTSLLRSVVKEGTARSLTARGIHFPVAGKTGTTNDYRDGWFVGYTPNILALVWVGFDNGRSIRATGSSAALPIWADLMQSIPHHISNDGFRVPAGIIQKPVCLDTGLLANKGACPATRMEVFLVERLPDGTCHLHRPSNPIQNMFKEVKNFFKKL